MSSASTLLGALPNPIHLLNGDKVSKLDFRAYDSYVQRQQKLFGELSSSAVYPHDTLSLGKVADQIQRDKQRDQIISYICTLSGNSDIEACQDALNLVTRLILMIEVGSLEKASGFMHQTGPGPLPLWDKDSLHSLTGKLFPTSSLQTCGGMAITPDLSAWSLENVAGIKIEFTDNLADHLRLTNNNSQYTPPKSRSPQRASGRDPQNPSGPVSPVRPLGSITL
ncbi:hypothetical protein FMEXI_10350 [Fusarium mexicanum]|uniref:Uncharacterized protein n=1 Tax=Fusarium mexicanum TaxID=751941 RepID=A0A8H5IGI5_9HYPO|nr:hypothetical protein FMEXI_10350 [Fusarium mexicanum]